MECSHIEEYRQPWENDEHWAKRKDFILKYWNEFKEYTLLCLAQVYADVELHGWSYPIPVLRYVRILPSNGPERTHTQDADKDSAAELVKKEEQEVPSNLGSSTGRSLQKRTNAEVFGGNLEENGSALSSPARKKTKLSDSTVPSDGNLSSEASVGNGRCNFTTSNTVYEKSVNGGNETNPNSSLATMQKLEIKDFQCETKFTSVKDGMKQSALQTVQVSDISSENSTDRAMDTEPMTSGKIFSGNVNNGLESLHSESSSNCRIQFDTESQISEGNTVHHASGSSAAAMQKSGIKDFQCETKFTSVKDEMKQSTLQTVQESGAISSENSTDQAMDTEPMTSGNIFSGNMNNRLESLHSEFSSHSRIQSDTGSQISEGNTVFHASGNSLSDNHTGELNSVHLESSHGFKALQSVAKSSEIRRENSSPQNSNADMVTLKNTCDSTDKSFKGEIKQNSPEMFVEKSVENTYKTSGTTSAASKGRTRQISLQSVMNKLDSTSSENCSETVSEFDMLPKSLKDNFTDILHFIWQLRAEQFCASEMLKCLSDRYNLRLEYHSEECLERNIHECSLEIDGVLVSKGKSPTKKGACREAGRLAFDKLMLLSTEAEHAKSNYCDRPCTSSCSKVLTEPVPDPFVIDLCGNTKYATSGVDRDVCLLNAGGTSQNSSDRVTQNSSEEIAPASDLTYIGNFCGIDNLPENLKAKFLKVSRFISTSRAKRINPVVIMNNISAKLKIKVKFDIREVKKKHYLSYECSLLIGSILVSKAEAKDIRNARYFAACIATDELMKFLRESYPDSLGPSEKGNSTKKKVKNKKKLNSGTVNHGSCDSNEKGSVHSKNSDMVSKSSSCESTGSPLKPLNSNSISLSYEEQRSGFIPLCSAGQKVSQSGKCKKRKNRKKSIFRKKSSNIFAILDCSDITKMDCFAETLMISASYSNVHCVVECDEITEGMQQGDKFRAQVVINGKVFCTATGNTRKRAREAAAKEALDLLKTTAYTVKVKDDDFVITPDSLSSMNPSEIDALPESNIGYKMLKIMGWTGGGIGRPENRGIAEPIEAKGQGRVKRGLGFPDKEKENDSDGFRPLAEKIITDYVNQSPTGSLIFSSEFCPWQRRIIQRLARKHGLWVKNFSTDNNKYTIVSRYLNAKQLVNSLLNDEGRTCKYELAPPSA